MFETVENISKTLANLEHERKAHLAELEEINKKIASLKETAKFFETDLNYCFEIPERLKTYLRYLDLGQVFRHIFLRIYIYFSSFACELL